MIRTKNNQKGFTVIELTMASAVFAVVLLLVTFGLLQIGRAFSKSVNEAKTQEAVRLITDDIARSIKFSGADITPTIIANGSSMGTCVGNRRYSYRLDSQINGGSHAFVIDAMKDGCNGSTQAQNLSGAIVGREMLGQRMWLDQFSVTPITGSDDFWRIQVRVIYGDAIDFEDDSSVPGRKKCRASFVGTHFCADSELTTIVQKRLE
jgi:prepilin-type N-terminal cleavage/methylation domain-containing protein